MANDQVVSIPYSPEALEDMCKLWNIPVAETEQSPVVAMHVLNAMWGIPIIPGPQSARRAPILTIGRVVQENFTHSYSEAFRYSVGTRLSRMQAWPALYEFEVKLLRMSERELLEIYDKIKGFADTHTGIAMGVASLGAARAIQGKSPAEIIRDMARRLGAGGDVVTEAILDRMVRLGEIIGRALATRIGAALSSIFSVVYVATIAEAYEKLEDIRNVAILKYRNGDISEAVYRHIMDLHPTNETPELYFE